MPIFQQSANLPILQSANGDLHEHAGPCDGRCGFKLFSGGGEGYFYALDARPGKLLWKTQLGAAIRSGPMSYAVNGKQHVAVAAGSALFVFKLGE